ncbi:hypothetical protein FRC01_005876, partial [Tulasnella sp. 417]
MDGKTNREVPRFDLPNTFDFLSGLDFLVASGKMASAILPQPASTHPQAHDATSLPVISVIEPTPLKSLQSKHLTNFNNNPTPTSSRHSQSPRLLYTGSLVLDDRNVGISLDGICFVAHAPPTSPTAFLSSPLPLALETMRGRPSLRVISILPFSSVQARLDDSADIRLYWHPDAYFAHEFFIKSLWKAGGWDSEGRSNQCLKVALGDE